MSDARIAQYRQAVSAMLAGHFEVHVPTGDDEVGKLGAELLRLGATVEHRFTELSTLLHVTEAMNVGLLLDEVLDHVYESFRAVIPYDRIGLALLEHEGRTLRARWARSEYPEVHIPRGYSAKMAGSSLEKVLVSRAPRILNDLQAYLAEHPHSDSTTRIVAEGIRSSLTCPLVALGKAVGFLFFSSREPGTYRDAHVEIFRQLSGQVALVVEKTQLYERLLEEQHRSEALLLNVLPRSIATRLLSGETRIADAFPEATILFADIVHFTGTASRFSPATIVDLLGEIFRELDRLTDLHGLEKIKTIGDAYMVAGGIPEPRADHVNAAADLALDILAATERFRLPDGEPLVMRVGLHVGPVVAGVLGRTKLGYDLWGDAVNVASRLESGGVPGRIQVSDAIEERLRHEYVFEPRGEQQLRGRGAMHTWFLVGRR